MAVLEIVTLPQAVLRQKARKVTNFGPDFQNLVDDMIETMRQAPGVGLAAPQVGEPSRLIVVEYGEKDEEKDNENRLSCMQLSIQRSSVLRTSKRSELKVVYQSLVLSVMSSDLYRSP
jgi:peptide deformylase